MRYSDAETRYQAQKENPDCWSFYKVEGGYACFYCAQALFQWLNQRQETKKMKTNKALLEEKLIKLIRNRERALKEKDWLKAADLEIRIEATEAKIDRL